MTGRLDDRPRDLFLDLFFCHGGIYLLRYTRLVSWGWITEVVIGFL